MIFPNISFFHMVVTDWTGPLSLQGTLTACEFSNARFFYNFYAKRLLMTQNEKPQVTRILASLERDLGLP